MTEPQPPARAMEKAIALWNRNAGMHHLTPAAIAAALDRERRGALEEAAKIADGFTCGGCGMDGKCAAAIRALAGEPS